MRHGTSSSRRQRGRGNNSGRRGNNQRTQVYDSNGPDVRIRGTAHQVTEKYLALAKDAAAAGDRIMAESYNQHAEHYQRIINSWDADVQAQPERKAKNENAQKKSQKKDVSEDDLSLPSSILGDDVKEKSEDRADEVVA